VADLLRLFVVGVTRDDAAAIAERVARVNTATVVGSAMLGDINKGIVAIPADIDAIVASPNVIARASRPAAAASPDLVEQLTRRERDVLDLLADGLPNREIARALAISEHTVKFHLASLFGKLGVASRTKAVRRGLELELIEI
jgi:DNA-binding NarL/FixJ family response regulator